MEIDPNRLIQNLTRKLTELNLQNAALETQAEMLGQRIWELENPEEAAARAAEAAAAQAPAQAQSTWVPPQDVEVLEN